MGLLDKLIGNYNDNQIKKLEKEVKKILDLDSKITVLSDKELLNRSDELKGRFSKGETLDELLPEAFALFREAAYRTLNKKHYPVQLIGGVVLHQGRIAEMKTGEGKTMVAPLAAYLNALAGKGVHIVTVNDYLANRDKEEMSKVFSFLGLTSGVILQNMSPEDRKAAYNCDITYGTNSEFGFDYLRDNMVKQWEEKVQRGLNYCIIDEVDSILIDEARTPLIISGQGRSTAELYKIADYFVKSLKEVDYSIDHKSKAIFLTEEGVAKAEEYYKIENYSDIENLQIQHHIFQALKANYIMKKEVEYIIDDGKVMIVDEFTGRVMDGRRFSDGLHEAIEAKENVKIENNNSTLATVTYQNFFRMYKKLSGMTGTALTEEKEFRDIYKLDVVVIPTNMPVIRKDQRDIAFKNEYEKFKAVVEDIEETNKSGQPILVGTVSVEKSELLSFMLKRKGVKHQVLNAKYHAKEADIVANAGQKGMVTISTNMAGRGTDIILGEGVQSLGGLKVIGTERHESRRIDNQLRGRAGRQGDPGESVFYLSFEDELVKNHMSDRYKKKMESILIDLDRTSDDETSAIFENAQKNIEADHFQTRKMLIEFDDVTNTQRKLVYEQRDRVLKGENLKEQILEMANEIIEEEAHRHLTDMVGNYEEQLNELKTLFNNYFALQEDAEVNSIKKMSIKEVVDIYSEKVSELYEKYENNDVEQFNGICSSVLLRAIDNNWIDHLDNMDYLKQYIVLHAYKQQEPAQAYIFEGSKIFSETIKNIKKDTVITLFNIKL